METALVIGTIASGFLLATIVIGVASFWRRRFDRGEGAPPPKEQSRLAGSILFQIVRAGGADSAESAKLIREGTLHDPDGGERADVRLWAELYREMVSVEARSGLLDDAVRLAVVQNSTIPVEQYDKLLDLSFGLGFQTDALARLRARYRFSYLDHAHSRPRHAGGRGRPERSSGKRKGGESSALATFGIRPPFSRKSLISQYRSLAAQCHPDKVHAGSLEEQESSTRRFIEITEAYEILLPLCEEIETGDEA
ncbi:MAG: J domain-containing protein [Thermoanaerobaculia bacterium]